MSLSTKSAEGGVPMDLFRKLDDVEVERHPFPFALVENILPEEVCDQLIREMPPLRVLTRDKPPGDNKRFNFSYAAAMTKPGISPLWREVLGQAMSQSFLDRILRIFGPSIREYYPDFEDRFAPINQLVAVPRSKEPRKPNSIMLDALIAVNTPALAGETSVRPAHLDRTDKLFVGLLYLRLPHDDSTGADLELLRPKDGEPLVYGHQRMLTEDKTTTVRTIPYKRNSLVLFLNTPESLHGVTPRQATPHTRYFINLLGEASESLFEVETMPAVEIPTPTRQGLFGRIWNNLAGVAREARTRS